MLHLQGHVVLAKGKRAVDADELNLLFTTMKFGGKHLKRPQGDPASSLFSLTCKVMSRAGICLLVKHGTKN